MKLADMTVSEFMQVLGSSAPAPGGGSASALGGAMGISLLKMVTELTIGKKKYADYETEMSVLREQAIDLQKKLIKAIDKDTESFNAVSAVFSMPKETDEEKLARSSALQVALKNATITPFEVMQLLSTALNLTQKAVGKSNTNAASDLGVAAVQIKAALQGAWLNVVINLSSIKDDTFVKTYKTKGLEILQASCLVADDIYAMIEKSL